MEKVCCMCGDVGFSDKLFRCGHCRNRFQHSYCSNYYSEFAEPTEICDWCQSDDKKLSSVAKHGGSSFSSSKKKKASSSVNYESGVTNQSEYPSGGGIKHDNNHHDQVAKSVVAGPAGGGVPSPRTATRRRPPGLQLRGILFS
ncbi:uncharacterized protein LOC106426039 isoform X2 [Brassica napus]|uniref:uncharacterized protein LOC106426039 isoform X2 n=1 Tax=Brassica napus TaxID=3708 RepID=UPI00207A3CF0|nr:uncharacterized protein LOC106426039 isoform X2 [Brassica napus]